MSAFERVPHADPGEVFPLAHVCGHWRAVALKDTRLWTELKLCHKQTASAAALDQIVRWFYRAYPRPVSFSLICDQSPYQVVYTLRRQSLLDTILISLLPQINTLELSGYERWFQFLARLPLDVFSQVNRLWINGRPGSLVEPASTVGTLECPHVTRLGLERMSFVIGSNALSRVMRMPWERLRSLKLTYIETEHDVGAVFFLCTGLEEVTLELLGGFFARQQDEPRGVVEFPHLIYLEIHFVEFPEALGSAGSYPALHTVHLCDRSEWTEENSWRSLVQLARQSPRLESLWLHDFVLTSDTADIRGLLGSLPLLRYLQLFSVRLQPGDIGHMLVGGSGAVSVPNLEHLHYDSVDFDDETEEDMEDCQAEAYRAMKSFFDSYVVDGQLSRLSAFSLHFADWDPQSSTFDFEPTELCDAHLDGLKEIQRKLKGKVEIEIQGLD
ncbi:hypothetical protein HDZ31DRAFT_43978 [Schizophyllum fasciatum]